MSSYIKSGVPGIYVRHSSGCRNAEKEGQSCRRCSLSYRVKTRRDGWSETFKDIKDATVWKAQSKAGHHPERPTKAAKEAQTVEELTFRAIAEMWWQAVLNSEIGTRDRRRGTYSPNTLRLYRMALDRHILPEMGDKNAAGLRLRDWQHFVDGLRRKGLKTNSINDYVNPVRATYGYACSPRRELLPVNAIAGVELPPVDETPRERVAAPAEAARLLAALDPDDQIVWGLAFYTGCRAMEIGGDKGKGTDGVDWKFVNFEQGGLFVPDSKSDAGVRWVPMVQPLRVILLTVWNRQDRPSEGRVVVGSVRSAKERAIGQPAKGRVGVWERAGMDPIGLHECRHTFVSYMAAAGVPSKLRSEIAGHEGESMTRRYTHSLPAQVAEAGALLDAYLEASA